jgi:amino acid transporter
MSRDGLLPAWFAQVHPRFHTPHRPTLIAGGLTALVAGFFPIKEVAELVNIGTLSAFVIICLAVIVLRRTRPGVRRTFRTPLVPWIPLAGICSISSWSRRVTRSMSSTLIGYSRPPTYRLARYLSSAGAPAPVSTI